MMSYFIMYYTRGINYKVLCEAHLPTLYLASSLTVNRPFKYGYDYCQRCQHEYDVCLLRSITATRARRVDADGDGG